MTPAMEPLHSDDTQQFAELLLHDGVIHEEDWQTAVTIQRNQGGRLLEILMGLCPLSEESLYRSIARQLKLPFWSEHELTSLQLPGELLQQFPFHFVSEYNFLPIRRDAYENTFHLILPNPLDQNLLHTIKNHARVEYLAIGISTPSALVNALQVHYRQNMELDEQSRVPEEVLTQPSQGFGIAPPKMEIRTCPACGNVEHASATHCGLCGSPMDLAQADPLIGKMVGRFQLTGKLGEGGMGLVYSAKHMDTMQEAAVKILRTHLTTNQRVVQRFHREAQAQNQLRHPNIVYVHDFGFEEGIGFYLAMEFLRGKSLEDVLAEKPEWVTLGFIKNMFKQVCEAMGFAHSRGIFHRDLKPDNIYLVGTDLDNPEDIRIKILDFGVAKMVASDENQRLTRTGMTIGTPLYMAPEQAGEGNTDHRSDIYSLAIILFEVLTGQPPFQGSSAYQIMLRHVYADPPTLRQLRTDIPYPPELDELLIQALAKDPQDRPASMDYFWQHLYHALHRFEMIFSSKQSFFIDHSGQSKRNNAEEQEAEDKILVGRMLGEEKTQTQAKSYAPSGPTPSRPPTAPTRLSQHPPVPTPQTAMPAAQPYKQPLSPSTGYGAAQVSPPGSYQTPSGSPSYRGQTPAGSPSYRGQTPAGSPSYRGQPTPQPSSQLPVDLRQETPSQQHGAQHSLSASQPVFAQRNTPVPQENAPQYESVLPNAAQAPQAQSAQDTGIRRPGERRSAPAAQQLPRAKSNQQPARPNTRHTNRRNTTGNNQAPKILSSGKKSPGPRRPPPRKSVKKTTIKDREKDRRTLILLGVLVCTVAVLGGAFIWLQFFSNS